MEFWEMCRAAEAGRDPNYLEAKRDYEQGTVEGERIRKLLEAHKLRMEYLRTRSLAAARYYCGVFEDEISVTPACKCQCEGEQ
jgi:hypothetical protein